MKLSEAAKLLKDLPGWSYERRTLFKVFEFNGFAQALSFVNKIAVLAEVAGHHPELNIQYSKVKVTLTTHDAGEVTMKDFDLAKQVEEVI